MLRDLWTRHQTPKKALKAAALGHINSHELLFLIPWLSCQPCVKGNINGVNGHFQFKYDCRSSFTILVPNCSQGTFGWEICAALKRFLFADLHCPTTKKVALYRRMHAVECSPQHLQTPTSVTFAVKSCCHLRTENQRRGRRFIASTALGRMGTGRCRVVALLQRNSRPPGPCVHGWAILKELHHLSNLCCYTSQDSARRDEETEIVCDCNDLRKQQGKMSPPSLPPLTWQADISHVCWVIQSHCDDHVSPFSKQQAVTVQDQYWHVCSEIPFCAFSSFVNTHPRHLMYDNGNYLGHIPLSGRHLVNKHSIHQPKYLLFF